MTLYETFQLLEDGEKLAKSEGGEKDSGKGDISTSEKRRLIEAAKQKGIELPTKGL